MPKKTYSKKEVRGIIYAAVTMFAASLNTRKGWVKLGAKQDARQVMAPLREFLEEVQCAESNTTEAFGSFNDISGG